jgi:tetratricopeptide (TPR) repeat protein
MMRWAIHWVEGLWSHYIMGNAPPKAVKQRHMALLLIIVTAVYANSLYAPFQFDDMDGIVTNQNIKDLGDLRKVLFSWKPPRPLVDLSFAINYHYGGLNPAGYHFVNLVLHVANCILVYLIACSLLEISNTAFAYEKQNAVFLAFFSALLFGIHPVNTESVAYIWGRSGILSGFFYLLALLFFIKYQYERVYNLKKKIKYLLFFYYFSSIIFYMMAIGSKSTALSLPFIIILSYFYFFTNGKIKKSLKHFCLFYVPYVVVSLARYYFYVQPSNLLGDSFRISPLRFSSPWTDRLGFFDNIMTQFSAAGQYLRVLFLPVGLNADHDFPAVHSMMEPAFLVSFAVVMVSVVGALWLSRRSKVVSFGILWFFIVLSFFFVVPLPDLFVERRLYLPSIGFCLSLTVGAGAGWVALRTVWNGRVGRALTVSVPVVCVVLLATATVARNVVWSDALSLWQDTVRKSPHKVRPYNNLATTHLRLRQFEAAIDVSKQALSLDPGSGIARYNLLEAYLYRGSWDVLVEALRDALRENPAHAVMWVTKRGRRLRRRYDVLRASLLEFGNTLADAPSEADTHVALGLVYLAVLRDRQQALEHLRTGLRFRLRRFRRRPIRRIVGQLRRQAESREPPGNHR